VLFTPLQIRGTTLRNRIMVAPMCQYSTSAFGEQMGALTDYHIGMCNLPTLVFAPKLIEGST
jgi:2,4-dienoyl-CoA reductase-like NADH-dependent reductase (Old Yellow Enzyme family)